jgi:tRNA(adenine34) deaminase
MAPCPDKGHRSATRAFPAMVPEFPDSDGAAISLAARAFWQHQWSGRAFMAIGMQDPVLGEGVMVALHAAIRDCAAPMRIAAGGHFVQEHGQPIAQAAAQFFGQASNTFG